MVPRRTRAAAFSLVEMMLSLLILSMLSVIMVGVVPASILGLRSAQEQLAAATIARGAMDKLRLRGFRQLPAGPGQLDPVTLDQIEYAIDFVVTDLPLPGPAPADAPEAPWTKRVELTVRWQAQKGERVYRLTRVVSRAR